MTGGRNMSGKPLKSKLYSADYTDHDLEKPGRFYK